MPLSKKPDDATGLFLQLFSDLQEAVGEATYVRLSAAFHRLREETDDIGEIAQGLLAVIEFNPKHPAYEALMLFSEGIEVSPDPVPPAVVSRQRAVGAECEEVLGEEEWVE